MYIYRDVPTYIPAMSAPRRASQIVRKEQRRARYSLNIHRYTHIHVKTNLHLSITHIYEPAMSAPGRAVYIASEDARDIRYICVYITHKCTSIYHTYIWTCNVCAWKEGLCISQVLQCVAVCCSALQCLEGLCISQAKTREIFDKHIYIHIHVKKNLHLYIHLHKFTSIHIPAICAPGRAVCIAGRDARDIQIRLHFVRWSATSWAAAPLVSRLCWFSLGALVCLYMCTYIRHELLRFSWVVYVDMTDLCVYHDSFISVPWLVYTRVLWLVYRCAVDRL